MTEYSHDRLGCLLQKAKTIDVASAELHTALDTVGELVDEAIINGHEEGLHLAVRLFNELAPRVANGPYRASLHYNLGNAHSGLRAILTRQKRDWLAFQIPEAEKELLELRRAEALIPNTKAQDLKCRVLTNLGNVLSFLGRSVEAINIYDRALTLNSSFAMAQGNRGHALFFYGRALHDPSHRLLFMIKAHQDLHRALACDLEPGASPYFKRTCSEIEKSVDAGRLQGPLPLPDYALGESDEEQRYRKWCLTRRLFLNPLNDIGTYPIASRDILMLPPVSVLLGNGPFPHGMFNQLKQEYATLRMLYYQGCTKKEPHYSG